MQITKKWIDNMKSFIYEIYSDSWEDVEALTDDEVIRLVNKNYPDGVEAFIESGGF